MRGNKNNIILPIWTKNLILQMEEKLGPTYYVKNIIHAENSDIQTFILYVETEWDRYIVIFDWNTNYPCESESIIQIIKIK